MQNPNHENTFEEQLRRKLIDQEKTIRELNNVVEILKREVRELESQKYKAYRKISELQSIQNV
jgi:chaperonin cofactor prefoldin